MFTREIIGSKFAVKKWQSKVMCAGFQQDKLKTVLLQYLRSLKILVAQYYSSNFNSPFYARSNNITQRHGIHPKLR